MSKSLLAVAALALLASGCASLSTPARDGDVVTLRIDAVRGPDGDLDVDGGAVTWRLGDAVLGADVDRALLNHTARSTVTAQAWLVSMPPPSLNLTMEFDANPRHPALSHLEFGEGLGEVIVPPPPNLPLRYEVVGWPDEGNVTLRTLVSDGQSILAPELGGRDRIDVRGERFTLTFEPDPGTTLEMAVGNGFGLPPGTYTHLGGNATAIHLLAKERPGASPLFTSPAVEVEVEGRLLRVERPSTAHESATVDSPVRADRPAGGLIPPPSPQGHADDGHAH